MPDIAVQTFTDPDAYHTSIRDMVEGIVTARGSYSAALTRIDFERIWMMRGDEKLPRVVKFTPHGVQRAGLLFSTNQRQPAMHVGGEEIPQGGIAFLGFDSAEHHRSSAALQWGAMSLTFEEFAAAGSAILGRELVAPPVTHYMRPPGPLLSRLRRLHEAAGRLARLAPEMLVIPEVARAIEQGLVHAMVTCIGAAEMIGVSRAHRLHAAAMRRLEEILEANLDRTLYVAELCAAAGVSERTLRACCQEHLGMSPTRYLWLRRMHLARRALRRADPVATTVTEIATYYGFWELGRFSVAYRSLFGETPSQSLRRPPEDPCPQKIISSPWELPEVAQPMETLFP